MDDFNGFALFIVTCVLCFHFMFFLIFTLKTEIATIKEENEHIKEIVEQLKENK